MNAIVVLRVVINILITLAMDKEVYCVIFLQTIVNIYRMLKIEKTKIGFKSPSLFIKPPKGPFLLHKQLCLWNLEEVVKSFFYNPHSLS